MIIISLIHNLALLVALSVISGFIGKQRQSHRIEMLLQGLIFGSAAVIGMVQPLVLSPGLIFDGCSVIISLCGLFFGPLAVSIAGSMAIVCRVLQGGIGAIMGVPVICSSMLLGYIFYLRRKHQDVPLSTATLWIFGLIVHVAMLLLAFALPFDVALSTLQRIGIPVILLYPLATILIGRILSDHETSNRSLAALRESEARLKEAQRIAHLGSWELNFCTSALTWSDETFRIFEIDKAQFEGTYGAFLTAVHPDDRDIVNAVYQQSLKTQGRYEIVHRILTPDGRVKYVHEQCETAYNGAGKPVRSVGTVQDITELKKAEEVLKKAKEDAEANTRIKSEFLSNIAHDLRTPMHAIMGFSSFLQSEQLTEKQKKFADIIYERSKSLLTLVEDLLDVSRLESGKLELRSGAFELKECVHTAFELAQAGLGGKDVAMTCMVADDIPRLQGDAVRLNQILVNLMSNAVKYTDKGTIAICVTKEQVDAHTCCVRFSIKDTGLGIPENKQELIFDAFTRFHEFEGQKERGGVGLGLYITKTLVDMMKGTIQVISKVGVGSEFIVTLTFMMTRKDTGIQ